MRRYTKIKGLSDIRRLPRLGKIRGGVKVKKSKTDSRCNHAKSEECRFCTYPKETEWFIVPPEVAEVVGDRPTELDVMLPVNDRGVVFPQAFEFYSGGRGLKCSGDGEQATYYDEKDGTMKDKECPCEQLEKKLCMQRGHLSFIIPSVSVGGVYQLTTSSTHSIIDLNSSLDYIEALVGRIAMVPLKLIRAPRITHHDGMRQTHYTMRLHLDADVKMLNQLRENTQRVLSGPAYVLPAPERENPTLDDGPTYDEDQAGDVIETKAEQVTPTISKKEVLDKIAAISTSEGMAKFKTWSVGLSEDVKTLPEEDRAEIRRAYQQKEDELAKKEQDNLAGGYIAMISSAGTIESLDKIMGLVEDNIKDGEARTKLRMQRDKRAQELKKKTKDAKP